MNLRRPLGFVGVLLLFSGCAGLHVRVDVFNGPKPLLVGEAILVMGSASSLDCEAECPPISEECGRELVTAYQEVLRSEAETASGERSILIGQVGTGKANGERKKGSAIEGTNETGQAAGLATGMVALFAGARGPFIEDCKRVVAEARAVEGQLSTLDSAGILRGGVREQYLQVRAGLQKLDQLRTEYLNAFRRVINFANENASSWKCLMRYEKALANVESRPDFGARAIAASAGDTDRIVGTPIFDPYIRTLNDCSSSSKMGNSEIEDFSGNSDCGHWVSFGKEDSYAQWGNAQFVVLREGLVVFHQKSLDFDPTPAIGAGAALAEAGLKVAAAVRSGLTTIPLGINKGGSTTGSSAGKANEDLLHPVGSEIAIESQEALLARREEAKLRLLGSLATLMERIKSVGSSVSATTAESFAKDLKSIVAFYQGSVESSTPTGGE